MFFCFFKSVKEGFAFLHTHIFMFCTHKEFQNNKIFKLQVFRKGGTSNENKTKQNSVCDTKIIRENTKKQNSWCLN